MKLQQVIDYWIKPALEYFPENLRTPNRVQFMLGIGLIESGYNAVAQEPVADALGFWQMEKATFNDCIKNFLRYNNEFSEGWDVLNEFHRTFYSNLASDCIFACYMSAIKVYRAPPAIPDLFDLKGMAEYWKQYYNASPNGASIDEALQRMSSITENILNY